MLDSIKLALIAKMIGDFWGFAAEEDFGKYAEALLISISSVIEFGQPKEEK